MIGNINEGSVRVAAKIGPSDIIHEKEFNQQKAEEARKARPVEKSEDSSQAEKKNDKKEKESGQFLVENKQVVYEKYDANGELILRLPPVSVNEKA
jgi:hypothetical protein